MDNRNARQYALAGAFTFFGILLIIGVIWLLGRDKGLTQSKFQVQVLFRSVGGLLEGAPIRLSGVNVGAVKNIEFLRKEIMGRRVKATLNIFDKYQNLLDSNAKFYIVSEGVLGEKFIEIKVGETSGVPLPLDRAVLGEDPMELQELATAFASAASSFQKTADDLNKDLRQIDIAELAEVLKETARSLTHTAREVDQLILDVRETVNQTHQEVQPLLQELRETNRRTRKVIDRTEEKLIDGTLFKVF